MVHSKLRKLNNISSYRIIKRYKSPITNWKFGYKVSIKIKGIPDCIEYYETNNISELEKKIRSRAIRIKKDTKVLTEKAKEHFEGYYDYGNLENGNFFIEELELIPQRSMQSSNWVVYNIEGSAVYGTVDLNNFQEKIEEYIAENDEMMS